MQESERERLRNESVDLLLEIRAAYLRTGSANALKHWDMIQDRMRLAARTTSSPEEWATDMARSLRLGAPSVSYSASLRVLADDVREHGWATAWLALVEQEYDYLMAMARSVAEQRKAQRTEDNHVD